MPTLDFKPIALGTLAALVLSGCVSVKMPEKMFSDAVDASKKAYQSVAGAKEAPTGLEFSYTVVFDEGTPVKQATEQCYERLDLHARSEFKEAELTVERLFDAIRKHKNVYSVECRIRAQPKTA